ncbi:MAG: hypothetical protein NTX52_06515 [Planctomycetota bacterium]|nr:hypothetical protein [Planctomycetota bacterium]
MPTQPPLQTISIFRLENNTIIKTAASVKSKPAMEAFQAVYCRYKELKGYTTLLSPESVPFRSGISGSRECRMPGRVSAGLSGTGFADIALDLQSGRDYSKAGQ